MAITLLKRGNGYNTSVCVFAVDKTSELDDLPSTTSIGKGSVSGKPGFEFFIAAGSIAYCGDGTTYRLFSNGWKKVVSSGGGGESPFDPNNIELVTPDDIKEWFEDPDIGNLDDDDLDGMDVVTPGEIANWFNDPTI